MDLCLFASKLYVECKQILKTIVIWYERAIQIHHLINMCHMTMTTKNNISPNSDPAN